MSYKAVIFDLDGTLLDTLDDLTNSVNYALSYFDYPQRTSQEIRSFLGNGIGKLIEKSIPDGKDNKEFNECLNVFREYYEEHNMDFTKPYDGIFELLQMLSKEGYKMAIVSNKIDDAVQVLKEKFFKDWIEVAVGDSVNLKRKPAPDSVLYALEQLEVDQEDAIYIGDSEVDFETAKNSKLDCISVLWGFRDKDYLEQIGATTFANDIYEVYDIITNNK